MVVMYTLCREGKYSEVLEIIFLKYLLYYIVSTVICIVHYLCIISFTGFAFCSSFKTAELM